MKRFWVAICMAVSIGAASRPCPPVAAAQPYRIGGGVLVKERALFGGCPFEGRMDRLRLELELIMFRPAEGH